MLYYTDCNTYYIAEFIQQWPTAITGMNSDIALNKRTTILISNTAYHSFCYRAFPLLSQWSPIA